jgi:hypothetical protein
MGTDQAASLSVTTENKISSFPSATCKAFALSRPCQGALQAHQSLASTWRVRANAGIDAQQNSVVSYGILTYSKNFLVGFAFLK